MSSLRNLFRQSLFLAGLLVLIQVDVGWGRDPAAGKPVAKSSTQVIGLDSSRQAASLPLQINSDGIPNLLQIHDRVFCGGMPQGESAFQELARMGVELIVSVDGAIPEVKLAQENSIRYVHLPCGYGGIPREQQLELAKVVREFDVPILFHCHHGKHRAPVAAVVGCLTAGLIERSQADAVLKSAGTDPHYLGLFKSVESARRADAKTLDELQVKFRSVSQVADLASVMVAMQGTLDDLERSVDSLIWSVAAIENGNTRLQKKRAHEKSVIHQILMLKEHYAELVRSEKRETRTAEFEMLLRQSHNHVLEFASRIESLSARIDSPDSLNYLRRTMVQVSANCRACHKRYRGQ